MIVVILKKGAPRDRGRISRLLVQVERNVFVGKVTPPVRDDLIEFIDKSGAKAIIMFDSNSATGFSMVEVGSSKEFLSDFEGVVLPKKALR